MAINMRKGKPNIRCQDFFSQHWPQANKELFGWSDQGRWEKVYFTAWAEDECGIAGAALFWKMGGVGYLSELLVDKAKRKRGYGRRLMETYIEECSDCHKLALKTYKDSASQRFYQALGFSVEAEILNDVHGIDWVYMERRVVK